MSYFDAKESYRHMQGEWPAGSQSRSPHCRLRQVLGCAAVRHRPRFP